jgi:SAM-dependent methyltransferase
MESSYGERYRDLYEQHWWWRARERFLLNHLRRLQPPGGYQRILDVGCGDGLFFDELKAFGEVEGVETDASLVTERGRAKGPIHVRPFDETFQPGKKFGLILMLDVVEHFEDDRACLRRALELLEPWGRLVITVPAMPALWTYHDDLNHHFRRYTQDSFAAAAGDAGLEVIESEYFFRWMVPLKLLLRAKEAVLSKNPDGHGIPPRLVNRAFEAVSRLEQETWGKLPIPAGSSLFAVAGRPRH